MFWNEPNLYGVSFKDVFTPPAPFFGIETPKVFPRFGSPYPQPGFTPQFPQYPQFPQIPQIPMMGFNPPIPQLGLPNAFPQLGLLHQFPQLGMTQQLGQFPFAGLFNPPVTPFTPYIPTANVPFHPYNVTTPMFHPYRPFTF